MQSVIDDINATSDLTEKEAFLATLRLNSTNPEVDEAIDQLFGVYEKELSNLKGRFKISEEDTDLTVAIAESETDFIKSELQSTTNKIAGNILFSALAGTVISATALSDQFLGSKINAIKSSSVTNLSGFRSGMEIRKALEVDDDPKFRYVGPLDNKTRPFCADVLARDKLFTLREIRELDRHPDAQLEPVFIYGGGFNCRHRWIYTRRR